MENIQAIEGLNLQKLKSSGIPPEITDSVKMGIVDRYKKAFHIITGSEFTPSGLGEDEELRKIFETLTSL